MRVTDLYTQQRRIASLLDSEERAVLAQDRVSSGRRITRPSDSPTEIGEVLQTRTNIAELTRRQFGLDAALPLMKGEEGNLGDIATDLRQVKSIALQANNATVSPEQRQIFADQIHAVTEQIRKLANAQVGSRYIFAGTNTTGEPFPADPPTAYTGDESSIQVDLGGVRSFGVSVPGSSLVNARDGASGSTDLFTNLAALEDAVRNGDAAGIGDGMTNLDADVTNVVRVRADVGSRLQYVQLVHDRIESDLTNIQDRQSQLEQVDLSQAILEEKTAETAQQAALAMASRLGQSTLLDYLR